MSAWSTPSTTYAGPVRRVLHGGADLVKLIATGAVMTAGGSPAPGAQRGGDPDGGRGGRRCTAPTWRPTPTGPRASSGRPGRRPVGGARLADGRRGGRHARGLGHLPRRRRLLRRLHRGRLGREQGWDADVLRKNDETTSCSARASRSAREGRRADRVRHRQRHLPARAQRPPVRVPGARTGQTPLEAIRSATLSAAELLRWEDRIGRVEAGTSPTWSRSRATRSTTSACWRTSAS